MQRHLSEFLGKATVSADRSKRSDFVITTPKRRFLVEFKVSSQSATVGAAAARLASWKRAKEEIPLLVVPFMGELGKRLCLEREIPWADLSGNAHIVDRDLFIHVEGLPNGFKTPGRPESIFAPAASRVTRWLLAQTPKPQPQRDIARSTDLDEGFTSRIVRRLTAEGFTTKQGRQVVVNDPELLLSAWYEAYDFSQHVIVRAHGVARTSEALCADLSTRMIRARIAHAATGLAAAWLHTRFAGFRLVSFFVEEPLFDGALEQLQLRQVERGENVWIIVPRDKGVFVPTEHVDGIPCVHKVQTYVDLKGHPERSAEAAEVVKARYLEALHVH